MLNGDELDMETVESKPLETEKVVSDDKEQPKEASTQIEPTLEKPPLEREQRTTPIIFPSLSDPMLSYETGLSIADGGLYYRREKGKADYCIAYHGHAKDEIKFYNDVVTPILKELYGVSTKVKVYPRKGYCRIRIYSKRLFMFKHKVLGLPIGKDKLEEMPISLVSLSKENLIELISGLFDGEGSISFLKKSSSKRRFPHASFGMSNERLVQKVADSLRNLGINTTNVYQKEDFDKRTKHTYLRWYFDVNGEENCEKLFNTLHLRNPKHIEKYKLWKQLGYYP